MEVSLKIRILPENLQTLNLPEPSKVDNIGIFSYVFVGDEAFWMAKTL